jgi:hypothetical protein
VETAGELLELSCELAWADRLVAETFDGSEGGLGRLDGRSGVSVVVERSRASFDTRGWEVLGRDAWHRDGEIVIRDVATSGFDVRVAVTDGGPRFTYRWRPPPRTRAASMLLRTRARLLARAVLLQYPVLWWASVRGRAPLHAPAVETGSGAVLLAGPSGVGKSTLIAREVQVRHPAVSDNLCVSDGTFVWGLVEPIRTEEAAGRRAPHGRREGVLANRVAQLMPGRVVVLRRGKDRVVRECPPELAERALVAGTYAAGELRRFWTFAAMLALGTGVGRSHPPVSAVAAALSRRLPCIEVVLPDLVGVRLSDLLDPAPAPTIPAPAWT